MESGAKRKKNDFSDMIAEPERMPSGWNPNKNGNRASPAVRHAMKKLEQLPSAERKRILPEIQRAMVVENIAANFVSNGNRKDMIQELYKLADTEPVGQEPSPPQKKGKTTSQPQKDGQTPSAMMTTKHNCYVFHAFRDPNMN